LFEDEDNCFSPRLIKMDLWVPKGEDLHAGSLVLVLCIQFELREAYMQTWNSEGLCRRCFVYKTLINPLILKDVYCHMCILSQFKYANYLISLLPLSRGILTYCMLMSQIVAVKCFPATIYL